MQTLLEKVNRLERSALTSAPDKTGLREKEGILIFETEALDPVDFDALIAESRERHLFSRLDTAIAP